MTTRVVIENGNDAAISGDVHVIELDSLGDPGTTHVFPPGDSGEFYLGDGRSLRVEEKVLDTDIIDDDHPVTADENVGTQSEEADQAGAADENEAHGPLHIYEAVQNEEEGETDEPDGPEEIPHASNR